MRNDYMPIGSYSSGTTKVDDIFSAIQEYLDPEMVKEFWEKFEEDENSEELDWILREAEDKIEEKCAPYTYFGGSEGDPADIGVWVDFDDIEYDVKDGEILKVNDTSEIPDDYEGLIIQVNDHGNMTLWGKSKDSDELFEYWSVV